ncbi:unnamed protein product [Phytomonas sp. Hart1]|nr:unnamed protein product [Phytomonas sp. Hart1]|eukprot:CCW67962.1 unnamed protein product [Phytomonas sp. isolate Hart1]
MSTSIEYQKGTDTKYDDVKKDSQEYACAPSSSSMSSIYILPHTSCNPRVSDRTTLMVLEDIFFTYVGCPSTKEFFLLQKDGMELQGQIKQGWNIPNIALEPVVPERLLAWHTTIDLKRQLNHEDTLGSTLLNSTTQNYLRRTFAHDAKDEHQLLPLILPLLEALPAPTRCNMEAINVMRELVGQHLRHLFGLVDAVLSLKGRWGRLDERERSRLHAVMKAVTTTRVKGLSTLQKGFVELNFSELGLSSLSAEIANYTEVRVLRLNRNRNLRHLPMVPPTCQTVLVGACSLETVAFVPKQVGPSIQPIFSRVLVMGLSYNFLTNLTFMRCFPSLRILDITGNRLASLDDVVASLQEHQVLVDICLAENPVSLLDGYRHFIVKACQRLKHLDGQRIHAEERIREAPLPPEAIPVVTQPSVKQRASPQKIKRLSNLFNTPSPLHSSLLTHNQSDISHNTVFLSAQIVALRQISPLFHTPLTTTSIDELLPTHSDLWQQVVNAVPCFDSISTCDPSQRNRPTLTELWAMHNLVPHLGGSKPVHHGIPLYTHSSSLTLKGGWGPIVDPHNNADYLVPIVLTDIALTKGFQINGTTPLSAGAERSGGKLTPSGMHAQQARKIEGHAMISGGAATRGKSPILMSNRESGDVYRPPLDCSTFTQDIPISEELSECLARAIRLRVEVHDTVELSIINSLRTHSRGSRRESVSKSSMELRSGRRQNLHSFKNSITHTPPLEATTEYAKDMVETHVYQLGDIFLHPGPLLALPSTSFYCSQLVLKGRLLLSEADRKAEFRSLREDQATLRKALEAYTRAAEAASVLSSEASELMDKDNLNRAELSVHSPHSFLLHPSINRQSHNNRSGSSGYAHHSGITPYLQRVLLCGARVVARITRLQELYKAADNLEVEVKLCLGRGPVDPSLQEVAPRKGKGTNKHNARTK